MGLRMNWTKVACICFSFIVNRKPNWGNFFKQSSVENKQQKVVGFSFNVPVNNFSVMLGRSHRFLGSLNCLAQ